jgi:hypothetical protein
MELGQSTSIEDRMSGLFATEPEKYISAAENLAREADEMAKFHTFRAKELEGK